jgi:iron complex outermembrane receptor protein
MKSEKVKNWVVCASMLAIPATLAPSFGAQAQSTGKTQSISQLEEVVITARKRNENLSDAPIALTAFTSDDLESSGANSLSDIVGFTPGVVFENNSVAVPGRIYTDIRFRGLGNELVEPFAQVGSVFLDGALVASGASSIDSENIERVEIVKGPSSALFGRSTFAGAVNYITKTPSLTDFSGKVTADFADYNTQSMTFAHEGPLIENTLGYRVYFSDYSTDGQYKSQSDGGDLGAESTQTFMGTLFATPTDELTLKLRTMYSKDDDGPPAAVWLGNSASRQGEGPNFANCFAQRPELETLTRRNDGVTPLTDFICGEVPITSLVDPNTQLVSDQTLGLVGLIPGLDGVPSISQMGLEREQIRVALMVDYQLGDYTLSSMSSYDRDGAAFIKDTDLSGARAWLNYEQNLNESVFQEFRIASPGDERLTWMLGASYFKGEFTGKYLAGGPAIVGEDGSMDQAPPNFDIDTALGLDPDGICPCSFNVLTQPLPPENQYITTSLFGTIGFELTDKVTVDLEWRYSEDELTQSDPGRTQLTVVAAPFATGDGTDLGANFYSFLPRFTVSYQPFDDTTLWATYSEGNNPGFFNESFAGLSPEALALNPGIADIAPLFLDEEELENFEIGLKQAVWDGRANFSMVAYMMEWTNQKTRTGILFANPGGGFSTNTLAVQGFNTDLFGIEFEGAASITDQLGVRAQFTYSDAEFQDFQCGFTDKFAPANADGVVECSGNTPLQFPEWSGSLSLLWSDEFTSGALAGSSYFARLDGIYTGEQFTDEQNFSYIGDYWIANARAGVQTESVRVELYVTNLFDDDQYLAGGRVSDFSSDTGSIFPFEFSNNQGLGLVPAQKRQVGIRVGLDF